MTGAVQERERSAATSERAAEFTRVYESRAYLVYNLAVRVTCERDSAMAAAETAFLRQAEPGASEDTLVAAVVTAAVARAKRKPRPSGVGDHELQLLRHAAGLAPPERAALALTVMANLTIEDTATVLGLGSDATAEVLERAMAGYAAAAGVEPGAVYDLYVEWGWADPPAELWERVYPVFRRALERTGQTDERPALAPRRRRPSRRALIAATVLCAALAGGGAVLATGGAGGGAEADPVAEVPLADPVAPAAPVPDTETPLPEASGAGERSPVAELQSRKHKPLTPAELDQLRLKELAMLRDFEKRETDRRLTDAQRDYAARKVEEFRELARERAQVERQAQQVAARERALQRARLQLAERRRREAAAGTQEPAQTQEQEETAPTRPQPQTAAQPEASDEPLTAEEAEAECVQDAESGAYICPQ